MSFGDISAYNMSMESKGAGLIISIYANFVCWLIIDVVAHRHLGQMGN